MGIGNDAVAATHDRTRRRRTDPWIRATIAAGLVVVLVIVELVLGVAAYSHTRNVDFALALACGGVLGLAIIDIWIRPRTEQHGARRLRRFMPLWSLLPFLCAMGSSAWVHYQQWERGLYDIRELAHDLAPPPVEDRDSVALSQVIQARLDNLLAARITPDTPASEKQNFADLARVVAHDLKRARGNPERVVRRARRDTILDFFVTLGAQALFVLWIPFLLMISIAKANHTLASRERVDRDPSTTRASDPSIPAARVLRDSLDLRDKRILAEDRQYFVPRLCFGALLVLGTTYVFAPFGLKTSYTMSLVSEHALPGQTSFALWCNNFSAVPVIVVGFVGFLIYALITATQRFAQDDLDDQAMFSLLVRGLVVILLGFALSSSPINDEASRLFVFIAGVFPMRALEAIAKRANIKIDPDFPSDGPGSFHGIPSLDPNKVFALRAAGIQSSYDLAAMPIEEIARRVRIDPRLLGRAVDRAILIDAVGCKLTEELEAFAITSATELVAAQHSLPPCVFEKLGDAPQRAADRLACDARISKVLQWQAGAKG